MKYALFYKEGISREISILLQKELERYDVRAEFFDTAKLENGNNSEITAIFVGGLPGRLPSNFSGFHIQLNSTLNRSFRTRLKKNLICYSDIPSSETGKKKYLGCPLFDAFRSIDIKETSEVKVRVPIIIGNNKAFENKEAARCKRLLSLRNNKTTFSIADLQNDFQGAIKTIAHANAAIVTSWVGELAAIHFNVPYVFYHKRRLFKRRIRSLQNEIITNEGHIDSKHIFVVNDIETLEIEINRILNDHQYSAGLLHQFQETKEILGNQPSIRSIAIDIVERLEA